ncbi:MAG: HypC/HybG/HupF family hydrogenase formation chaperone [Calditrichaeota bacterium]|nr:HypC/HybG/HupF family hydrogenase formation chaperone [Calditrichota bacterium]MCB9367323.1 HypC/HybG/HupF family hydrogenase formation chaperone [Calditrichota bacterium]
MCLAVPMRLIKKSDNYATAESSGITLNVDLSLVPDASIGDYLLVHAGFALAIIDEDEARDTLDILRALEGE